MFVESRPTDLVTHAVAERMAREIVHIFSGVLMDHEKPEALYQSYLAARRGLAAYQEKRDAGKPRRR